MAERVPVLGGTRSGKSAAAESLVAGRASPLPPNRPPAVPASLRAHGDKMVPDGALNLAVNVWGDGPPEHVRKAIEASLDDLGGYPDDAEARAALGARHGRGHDEVCVTAGAAEAFWLLAQVVGARRAVVVHPQFTEPEAALRAAGVPVGHCHRRKQGGWRLDPAAVPAQADLVMVGNPTNPTGTLDPPESVAALCRPGRVTVVDEAFMDFVAEPEASLAGRSDLPGLVVVRSVTKLWGLAGARAGYLLAGADLVSRLAAHRQPWSVSAPALAALAVCAGDEQYRLDVARQVARQRARLATALRAIPDVSLWPAAANFLLVRVPDGPTVHAGLRERGIAVRPSTFPGLSRDHLRVAVRDAAASGQLVEALTDVLASTVTADAVGNRR